MIKSIAIVIIIVATIGVGWYLVSNFTPRNNVGIRIDGETKAATSEPVQDVVDGNRLSVTVDYAWDVKDKPSIRHHISLKKGQTAFDALIKAVGEENVEYRDLAGGSGVFIKSINGVVPSEGKFWLYKIGIFWQEVNADSYKAQEGDKIKFVISIPR